MTVTTAAAAPAVDDDDDDDRHRSLPPIFSDNTLAIIPAFPQQGDDFYNERLHLAHSISNTTLSINEEQHTPLPAVTSTADNAFPANDDPENITAVLSELDNLHHELMQLLHGSSASPSFTLATTDALTTDEHDRNNCNNDEYDDSDHEANDRDNHNDYANDDRSTSGCNNDEGNANDGHENGYAIKDRDDKDCGDTREPAANNEQGNIAAFLSELDTLHIELMQRLHSQHPEVTIDVPHSATLSGICFMTTICDSYRLLTRQSSRRSHRRPPTITLTNQSAKINHHRTLQTPTQQPPTS